MANIYRHRSLFFCLILFLLAAPLTACDKEETHASRDQDINIEKFMTTFDKPNQEYVALLSAKHQVPFESMEKFLDTYLSATDMGHAIAKNFINKGRKEMAKIDHTKYLGLTSTDYNYALLSASQSSNIPVVIAAQIAVEYNLLAKSTECE